MTTASTSGGTSASGFEIPRAPAGDSFMCWKMTSR